MRKMAMKIVGLVLMCPVVVSIAIHLYHIQYPRFYDYRTAKELESYILQHVQIGKTTRVEAETFLGELGINNCPYEPSANINRPGGVFECDVLAPRPEDHNTLFHYLFVIDYYHITMDFRGETLDSLLIFNDTNSPLRRLW